MEACVGLVRLGYDAAKLQLQALTLQPYPISGEKSEKWPINDEQSES